MPDPARRDEVEAAALYDLIGKSVAPLFYDTSGDGLPARWLEMVSHTLHGLGPRALATRMVRQYVTELYAPAARSSRVLAAAAPGQDGSAGAAPFDGARELASWKERVTKAWPGVRIEHVEADDGDLSPGGRLTVRASVALGALAPDDVTVEVVYGRAGDSDEIIDPARSPLRLDGEVEPGRSGQVLGRGRAWPARTRSATRSACCRATGCCPARPSSAWSRCRWRRPEWSTATCAERPAVTKGEPLMSSPCLTRTAFPDAMRPFPLSLGR